MAEKDFQNEISRSIVATEIGLYHKIQDIPVSHFGDRAHKWNGTQKPFDCFWALPKLWLPMELKQTRGLSINIGDKGQLRQHQEEALLHLCSLGFPALVLINFQHQLTKKQALQAGYQMIDRAFACRADDLVQARTALCQDGIPIAWFEDNGLELELQVISRVRYWRVNELANWVTR